jgi:hypothetical protein
MEAGITQTLNITYPKFLFCFPHFGFRFKYQDATTIITQGEPQLDLSAYFTTLQYVLMGSVFIALALIFLYTYYGKDEETEED